MTDRLAAVCLALLLAAPLCLFLDGEIFAPAETSAREAALRALSEETIRQHAEGLQAGRPVKVEALAAN